MDRIFDIWQNNAYAAPLNPLPDYEGVCAKVNSAFFIVVHAGYPKVMMCGLGAENFGAEPGELAYVPDLYNCEFISGNNWIESLGATFFNKNIGTFSILYVVDPWQQYGSGTLSIDYVNRPNRDMNITQLVKGNSFTLFIDRDKYVYSSGNNLFGQLGRITDLPYDKMYKIEGIPALKKVAAANASSYLLTESGQVLSCGYNENGELGRTIGWSAVYTPHFELIPGLDDIVDIVAGEDSAFFLKSNGEVLSCGNSTMLARDITIGTTKVSNLGYVNVSNIVKIVTGTRQIFFIDNTGQVFSAGNSNYFGTLGRATGNDYDEVLLPALIPDLPPITDIICNDETTFFITSDKRVFNCGDNNYGNLGRNVPSGSEESPNLGEFIFPNIKQISCTNVTFYVLNTNHEFFSCGYNYSGQLGRPGVENGTSDNTNFGKIGV
jgi:alpha-tubulin suppressor-like RCC1 family protein